MLRLTRPAYRGKRTRCSRDFDATSLDDKVDVRHTRPHLPTQRTR